MCTVRAYHVGFVAMLNDLIFRMKQSDPMLEHLLMGSVLAGYLRRPVRLLHPPPLLLPCSVETCILRSLPFSHLQHGSYVHAAPETRRRLGKWIGGRG